RPIDSGWRSRNRTTAQPRRSSSCRPMCSEYRGRAFCTRSGARIIRRSASASISPTTIIPGAAASRSCTATASSDDSGRVNLILLDPADVGTSGDVRLSGARATHLINVLNVSPGQSVRIGLLDGPLGAGTVQSLDDGAIVLRCVFNAAVPTPPPVDLLLALPRPKVMRRIWAQPAALGVGRSEE